MKQKITMVERMRTLKVGEEFGMPSPKYGSAYTTSQLVRRESGNKKEFALDVRAGKCFVKRTR